MSKVTVRCTHCLSQLNLKDRSRLGKQVNCPKCGKPFILQEVDEWDGLDDIGPATSSQSPVVRGGAKNPNRKRRKSSSGMSGGLLAIIIGGVAVLLLVAVGVGLWASGMFAPPVVATGDALAQTDQANTTEAPGDTAPVETQPSADPNPEPAPDSATVTAAEPTPETTSPTESVTTTETPEPTGDGRFTEERRVWKTSNGGLYTKQSDGTWLETWSAGTTWGPFVEADSTDDYLEITRSEGTVVVRLYDDHSEVCFLSRGSEFERLYEGQWVSSDAAGAESPEPMEDGLSDAEVKALVQAAIRKFVEGVAADDINSARRTFREFMLDESTTQQAFGELSTSLWPIINEMNAEGLAGMTADRRAIRILLTANVKFDVVDYRARKDNRPKTNVFLTAVPRNVRVLKSQMVFRGETQEFIDCVVVDGQVRGLPPLPELLGRLDDGALPMPQLASRPLVPLDAAGEAFAGGSAGDTRADNVLQATVVWCPPGTFQMGTTQDHKPTWARTTPPPEPEVPKTGNYAVLVEPWLDLSVENPVDVELTTGFWIGQTEVTRGQWQSVMNTRPWASGVRSNDGDDYPAIFVTWEAATEFCQKLTTTERLAGRLPDGWEYALPTEAQWEYACRTGTKTHFSFGDDPAKLPDFGWYISVTGPADEFFAHRVAQKQPNPWGLYDMHGNVEEMCRDFYSERLVGGVDPLGPEFGDTNSARGGHFAVSSEYCRSASRSWAFDSIEEGGSEMQGFRVAIVRSMVPDE